MSKMDELRAMREAKYARANASAKPTAKKPTPLVAPREEAARDQAPEPAADTEALCGHRSMNGRTCTREAGHSAKSHRYS